MKQDAVSALLSVCGDGRFILCTLIGQDPTGVQPHPAPESNQLDSGQLGWWLLNHPPTTHTHPQHPQQENPQLHCCAGWQRAASGWFQGQQAAGSGPWRLLSFLCWTPPVTRRCHQGKGLCWEETVCHHGWWCQSISQGSPCLSFSALTPV